MQEGGLATTGSYSYSGRSAHYKRELFTFCREHMGRREHLLKPGLFIFSTYSYSVEGTCYSRELFILSREDMCRKERSLQQGPIHMQ